MCAARGRTSGLFAGSYLSLFPPAAAPQPFFSFLLISEEPRLLDLQIRHSPGFPWRSRARPPAPPVRRAAGPPLRHVTAGCFFF